MPERRERMTNRTTNLPIRRGGGGEGGADGANQEIRDPLPANQEIRDPSAGPGHRGWNYRGYLPHFDGALTQAVTLHLGDSLPREALERMRKELEAMAKEEQGEERRRRIEQIADAGAGCCVLRNAAVAQMVRETLYFFDGERYRLRAWVIMPNHIHVLVRPCNEWSLNKIVASWKKHTARRICEHMRAMDRESPDSHTTANREIRGPLVPLPVWHAEFWDRYMRDEEHFARSRHYIHQNPVKAGLVKRAEDWEWSSAAAGMQIS
jgi:putative transposase